MQSVSYYPLIATLQLWSAASLNFGWSQNDASGNGLKRLVLQTHTNKGLFGKGLTICVSLK